MYHIALIEEEVAIREYLRWVLENAGYRVHPFAAAWQFLKESSTATFDLVIMNMALPDVNGSVLAWLLRKNPSTADIPILATTVFDSREYSKYSQAGADEIPLDGILHLPVAPDKLVDTVKYCLIHRPENNRNPRSNSQSA